MVELHTIQVTGGEGPSPYPAHLMRAATTWGEAEARLCSVAAQVARDPDRYYKTDVVYTWADGATFKARHDIKHVSRAAHERDTNPSRHLCEYAAFYGGLWRPPHISAADYPGLMRVFAPARDPARLLWLDYDLGPYREVMQGKLNVAQQGVAL